MKQVAEEEGALVGWTGAGHTEVQELRQRKVMGEGTSWGQRIDMGAGEQTGRMWDSRQGLGCTVRPPRRSGLM